MSSKGMSCTASRNASTASRPFTMPSSIKPRRQVPNPKIEKWASHQNEISNTISKNESVLNSQTLHKIKYYCNPFTVLFVELVSAARGEAEFLG